MKSKERDELLVRLDERTCNIWRVTEQQEKHLEKLNGHILEQGGQISSNKTSIKWIKIILIGAGLVGGGVTGIVNLIG